MATKDTLGVQTGGWRPGPGGPAGAQLGASSVRRMLAHQVASGAIYASMDFAPYRYCWLRDGSFTAFALDRAGEREASERFHRWAAAAITGIAPTVRAATERRLAGGPNIATSMPPARYTVEGTVEPDDWPNFQVDGYGTWMWALSEHVNRWGAGSLLDDLADCVELVSAYLEAVGLDPCYDCWEENGDAVHTSTLGCVYGGLSATAELLGRKTAAQKAEDLSEHILSQRRSYGRFAKSNASSGVDASLLWLAVPFGVVGPGDPAMDATAAEIEQQLDLEGGTRRYAADTYYGGGAWPLLTAWLGWYRARAGDLSTAQRCASWVEDRFDTPGHLPEQVAGEHRDPEAYRTWVGRWGPPAADLAWSHAMYFVLRDELQRAVPDPSPNHQGSRPASGDDRPRRQGGCP
ncbi:MAG TPA: glycoside hydrolase family 15 protein [Acidimicrobiales bacterium]|nr:glycoside hydrolase family 15 protein [Acidimicrobiales bacterium]